MKYNNDMDELLHDIIKRDNLYGRSFTLGVALYKAIQLNALDDEQYDEFTYHCETFAPEVYAALENINAVYNYKAWAEILDISALDEIARLMARYDEEDN